MWAWSLVLSFISHVDCTFTQFYPTVQALFSQNTLSDCYFLFLKLTKSRKSINSTLLKEHIEGNLTCMENQPPEGISLPF